MDNAKMKALPAFTADEVNLNKEGGANAMNFVSGWGATGSNSDKFSARDEAENTIKILRGVAGVNNVEENWIEMISPDNATAAAAVYTKLTVPMDTPNFRVWTYAPVAGDILSGKGKVRIVFFVPNEEFTSYLPVGLGNFNFAEQTNWNATVDENGYLTYENGLDGFFAFTVPDSIKGKTVIMVVELARVSTENTLHDRFAFKRMGFI